MKKIVFVGFQERYKSLQNLGSEEQEIILNRDVTFDEALMVKPTNSQHVESEKTKWIPQLVENDATSSSVDKIISLEIIPVVTQSSDHVADQDADNDVDQGQVMGNIYESIIVGRPGRIHVSLVDSLQI